jgi:hypothetical protein
MIIDKATTCYVVAVLAACITVVVVHDGYFSRTPVLAAQPAQTETAPVNPAELPALSAPSPGDDMLETLHPPALTVFSLPVAAEDANPASIDVSHSDDVVVKPFRIVRDRPCRTNECVAWTVTDLNTGKRSSAVVDLAPLGLAPAIASPARKGIVDLLITAEVLPDSDKLGATLHLRAVKLEGVAPHRLAVRAPASGTNPLGRHPANVAQASLASWLAPNGF